MIKYNFRATPHLPPRPHTQTCIRPRAHNSADCQPSRRKYMLKTITHDIHYKQEVSLQSVNRCSKKHMCPLLKQANILKCDRLISQTDRLADKWQWSNPCVSACIRNGESSSLHIFFFDKTSQKPTANCSVTPISPFNFFTVQPCINYKVGIHWGGVDGDGINI